MKDLILRAMVTGKYTKKAQSIIGPFRWHNNRPEISSVFYMLYFGSEPNFEKNGSAYCDMEESPRGGGGLKQKLEALKYVKNDEWRVKLHSTIKSSLIDRAAYSRSALLREVGGLVKYTFDVLNYVKVIFLTRKK